MNVDLRETDFQGWLSFVFDHPIKLKDDDPEWYFSIDELKVDPARQVEFMRRIFEDPTLLEPYSAGQVEQGFWFMFGSQGKWDFTNHLWNPHVAWHSRRACIRAIATLYEKLFGVKEIGSAPFMLWDLLTGDYEINWRHPRVDSEDRRVQEEMLHTLERMLNAPESEIQRAALHGLHHLGHKNAKEVVRRFLAARRQLDRDTRDYAHAVLKGEVL